MTIWSIVVAAGTGTRFGGPKQLAPLQGRPVLAWALDWAAEVSEGVVLVVPADIVGDMKHADLPGTPVVVAGGDSRSASVRAGLAAVPASARTIVVHDGARPLADGPMFGRVIGAVRDGAAAAVTVVPVTDTIRRVAAADGSDDETGTVDRTNLRAVQTPQAFWAEALRSAHEAGDDATDDATLVEAAGGRVVLVPGSPENIKITTPVDLVMAEAIIDDREEREREAKSNG